jgi:hypothetical protein
VLDSAHSRLAAGVPTGRRGLNGFSGSTQRVAHNRTIRTSGFLTVLALPSRRRSFAAGHGASANNSINNGCAVGLSLTICPSVDGTPGCGDDSLDPGEQSPLLKAGRASERVNDFIFEHHHGARQRATIVLRLMLEEGLNYQRSLCQSDTQVQHVDATHSVDSLTVLVNQRLEREGDLARASQDNIRAAIAVAASALFNAVHQTEEAVTIISRFSTLTTT